MDTAAHLARIERDGWTVVEGVFDPAWGRAVVADLERIETADHVRPHGNSFEGAATWRIYNLLAKGELYARIPVDPLVLPIVEGVLDRGCLISSLSSIAIAPGERAQPIHADDQAMPLSRPHVATVCNTMWALTEFTEENGATRLVTGSHTEDHAPVYGTHYDSIPAEMPAGSVLIWHGSLWHGGGANRTDRRRYGIAMNYCAGWIRQQENQQLGIPMDVIASFPPRLQELCGFATYRGLIGHIDRSAPVELFLGAERRQMLWDAIPVTPADPVAPVATAAEAAVDSGVAPGGVSS
jgi:ectoine hydroxylase-related dioxygenase (phytanoyl-CoA dioxygenase family)